MHDPGTTVVAVATPPGRGGIGCLRLSGTDALTIAEGFFRSRSRPGPGARLCFGRFLDRAGRALDHGYLVVFAPERAYTGELTVEAWSHGSPAVLAELVECAVDRGAELAGPGEFTYRALTNGRIDLARAFMQHKQVPFGLRNKIYAYYALRNPGSLYFDESDFLSSLSTPLRRELL